MLLSLSVLELTEAVRLASSGELPEHQSNGQRPEEEAAQQHQLDAPVAQGEARRQIQQPVGQHHDQSRGHRGDQKPHQ